MGKKLTLFLFILTVNLTVFGQVNLLPKRIVYQGDTGIFLTKKQEVEILKTFEYKEIYKSNLDSMFRFVCYLVMCYGVASTKKIIVCSLYVP
jgi:hypothetical protein